MKKIIFIATFILSQSFSVYANNSKAFLEIVKTGNLDKVILAIKAGANVNSKNKQRVSALSIAISYLAISQREETQTFPNAKYLEIIKYLLDNKDIDVNIFDDLMMSPLMLASLNTSHPESLELLLKHPLLKFNLSFGDSAIELVQKIRCDFEDRGCLKTLPLLVKASEELEKEIKSLTDDNNYDLAKHIKKGDISKLYKVIDSPLFDVNAKEDWNESLLNIALKNNHKEIAMDLLSHTDVKIDKDSFIYATKNDQRSNLLHLLSKDDRPEDAVSASLITAVMFDRVKTFEYLIKNEKIDINKRYKDEGTRLISAAAKNGNIEIMKIILKQPGLELNHVLMDGRNSCQGTALAIAAEESNLEMVKLLLDQPGIDYEVGTDYLGNDIYPLYAAALAVRKEKENSLIILDLILSLPGIQVRGLELGLAAGLGELELLKTLVNHPGTDINLPVDTSDRTALMDAARSDREGSDQTLKYLLTLPEIDVKIKDGLRKTAYKYAKKSEYKKKEKKAMIKAWLKAH